MAKLHITELTAEQLLTAEIPMNHVLVETEVSWDGKKSKGGIIIGFNDDVLYSDGEGSHVADLTIPYGVVKRTPNMLYFNPDDPNKSMDWETEMDLVEEDTVWFSLIESRNAVCVLCENKLYRVIPYSDCYCFKREIWVDKWKGTKKTVIGVLNGYVLCKQCFLPKLGPLDALSEAKVDKTRGIIAYIGEPVKRYARDLYCDIPDLKVGDEVIFEPRAPLFLLERLKETAVLDGNLYWVTQRRRIIFVNNK